MWLFTNYFKSKVVVLRHEATKRNLLLVNDGLDIEAQCWTDNTGVLTVNLQNNCCLPRIVKPTVQKFINYLTVDISYDRKIQEKNKERKEFDNHVHHEYAHFFLFLLDFSNYTEKPHFCRHSPNPTNSNNCF